MVSVVVTEPYPGWDIFLPEIKYIFTKVNELRIINKVTRYGIRYVDFFESDIFGGLKLQILLEGKEIESQNIILRVVLDKGKFQSTLQISNDASVEEGKKKKKGSLLDLDTYSNEQREEFFQQMDAILNESHDIEKELFYGLLRPEFLASLNPVY